MTTERVNLTDLKAKRAAMTPGRLLTVNPPFGDGTLIRSGAEDAGGDDIAECAMVHYIDGEEQIDHARFEANAAGIVATHNAADVLIEIAAAELALRDSRCDCTTEFHDSTADDCPMGNAEVKLATALAKITT